MAICLISVLLLSLNHKSSALTSNVMGDGYVPFTYKGNIYNIFHHQNPSSDPANPIYDINCTQVSGQDCANPYPRYFSSNNGSTGRLGLGTPGVADIYTSTLPQSLIVGSRLFYAAQRAADNGMGCFDLDTATNCGYFQLGILTPFVGFGSPGRTDGIEQVGNKLYAIGDDIKMYCLDVTDPSLPVACVGQPYAVNTGITIELPAATATPTSRLVKDGLIYFLINYNLSTPAADARISCFDPALEARCTSWNSLDITATSGVSSSSSLFEFPNISGVVDAICTDTKIEDPVQCWNLTTRLSVPPPPNMFSGISRPIADSPREEVRVGQKTYFPIVGFTFAGTHDGFALCYDFAIQARCSGFGTNGYKLWDGSDGGYAINNGDTRDYGYFYNNGCMLALGDSGILWSFSPVTGAATPTFNCVLAAHVGLPDAGVHTSADSSRILLYSLLAIAGISFVSFGIRHRKHN